MSNQKKEMGSKEAKKYVKNKAKKAVTKLGLGVVAAGVSKIPGGKKVLTKIKKLKEKIPKSFSASYDPKKKKASIGLNFKF